ncbi:MAG: hypothetical protein WC756_20270 [Taibaiella sp.]|jgi:integrase
MTPKHYVPRPVFDTLDELIDQYKLIYEADNPRQIIRQWLTHCFAGLDITLPQQASRDYQLALSFLYSYRGSPDTFRAYRRDIERLLQWSWFVKEQSPLKHNREDIEAFIMFCLKPYKRWIGLKTVARFKLIEGEKKPNPVWRPFDVTVSKKDHQDGLEPTKEQYQMAPSTLKVMFGVLSSFYNFLLQDGAIQANPVQLIRQKSKFIRKEATAPTIRRLSPKQWQTVLTVAHKMADENPQHERTLFIVSCLYGMYLRISELTASTRWIPLMNDFFKDNDGNWWFKTVGKGNKARQITVSTFILTALKRYRKSLGLSPYPLLDEKTPLIPHEKNQHKAVSDKRWIRTLVQGCFDQAADQLNAMGDKNEAVQLRSATVHWLRHTGISDDVKVRPREHVRDDAGHSSGAITDRYINIGLQERAASAKNKKQLHDML